MKKLYPVILLGLILLPLGATVWLGLGTLQESSERTRIRVGAFLTSRLEDWAQQIQSRVKAWEAEVQGVINQGTPEAWARASRENPWVSQVFKLNEKFQRTWPEESQLSSLEGEAWDRMRALWDQGWVPPVHQENRDLGPLRSGWKTWFWSDRSQWLYWTLGADQGFTAVLVNQSALLGDLIQSLKAPAIPEAEAAGHRILLKDPQMKSFLQWGRWKPENDRPLATVALPPPLEQWTLTYSLDPKFWPSQDSAGQTALGFSLTALVLVILAVGFWAFRTLGQDLRNAAQRVSFVNQVSHELKTPLTNIRLYSELLEDRLEAGKDPQAREFLDIIQREVRRLSRMIHNVLTFGRQKKEAPLHPRPGDLAQGVLTCVKTFEAPYREKGLNLEVQVGDLGPGNYDPDVLDQILGNLLSNAEKYAAAGGRVLVEGRTQGEETRIWVQDWGPGLPPGAREKLFQPFEMFHMGITEALGGSGLGLHISRQLCRQHGGDLVLEESPQGCRFCIRLFTGEKP